MAAKIERNSRYIQTKISRSMSLSLARDPDLRLRTITWCRRTRISASSLARDFNRRFLAATGGSSSSEIHTPKTEIQKLWAVSGHSGEGGIARIAVST
jgi:hypothetical protein